MAVRFQLASQGAAPISPAFDAGWEQTGSAVRQALVPKFRTTVAAALANATAITVPITTTQDILGSQWVGPPMLARRITGTISLVVRVLENASTNNVTLAVVAKVVSFDGSVARGTLFSTFNTDTEFGTTASTRIVNAQAITPLTIQTGDRLVIELGGHAAGPTAAGSYTMRFGNSAASDFALTSGLTTDLNPWVELSDNLDAACIGNYVATGYGALAGERIR